MTGQGVGDHERRRTEIARTQQRMDAAVEVAVARQDAHQRPPILRERQGLVFQGTRLAPARGAGVSDDVEPQSLEGFHQAGIRQVAGHREGTGRERGLHPGRRLQAALRRRPGEQPRAHHGMRVRGIRARGDRRHGDEAGSTLRHRGLPLLHPRAQARGHACGPLQVVRLARTGDGPADLREVDGDDPVIRGHRGRIVAEQPCRPAIILDERHLLVAPAGDAQIFDRAGIDRPETRRRAIFGSHVRQGRPIRDGHVGHGRPEEFQEAGDHPLGAQDLRGGKGEIRDRDAGSQFARQANADEFRNGQDVGLTKQHRLGLDAARRPSRPPQGLRPWACGNRRRPPCRERRSASRRRGPSARPWRSARCSPGG